MVINYGFSSVGFTIKPLTQIQTEMQQAIQGAFGLAADISDKNPFGQFIGIMSEREFLIWQLAQMLYNSQYRSTSEGASLDNADELVNIPRIPPTYSTVTGAIITGTAGIVIQQGSLVSVSGNSSAQFATDTEVTIGSGGTVTVNLTATTDGPVLAPATTLTVINTLVSGWTSITNPYDAVAGDNEETDPAYLLRSTQELQSTNAGPVSSIVNALLAVPNVSGAGVIENISGATVNSQPAGTIQCVVTGGDPQAIAQAIFNSKPTGVPTYGTTTETVIDSQGVSHSISFSVITTVPIYVIVNATKQTGASVASADIQNAILNYGANLVMGQTVAANPGMMATLAAFPLIDCAILISTSPTPTTSTAITMQLNQLATFSAANIAVNIS